MALAADADEFGRLVGQFKVGETTEPVSSPGSSAQTRGRRLGRAEPSAELCGRGGGGEIYARRRGWLGTVLIR